MLRLAAVAVAGILVIGSTAVTAQAPPYTINGQPAPPDLAYRLAAQGLPFGNYWLTQNGYWGVVGNSHPLGNIYANPGNGNAGNGVGPRTRCRTWGTGGMRCD